MSIADHFEHAPDAIFVRNFDTRSARRQFNVSLVLIVVIAVAASALGFLVRFDSPSVSSAPAASVATAPPAYAGRI